MTILPSPASMYAPPSNISGITSRTSLLAHLFTRTASGVFFEPCRGPAVLRLPSSFDIPTILVPLVLFLRRSTSASVITLSLLVRPNHAALPLFDRLLSTASIFFGVPCESRRSEATTISSHPSATPKFPVRSLPCRFLFADRSLDHSSTHELFPHCS